MGGKRFRGFHKNANAGKNWGEDVMHAYVANRVTPMDMTSRTESQDGTVNTSIPVGRMNEWQLKAIRKVLDLKYELRSNWDSYASTEPSQWVIDAAISIVESVAFDDLPAPRIV